VLNRTERQFFGGNDLQSVMGPIQYALQSQGIRLQQVGPQAWNGGGAPSSWGMAMKVSFFAMQSPSGYSLELNSWADLEGNGVILLCVLGVFFFPAALIIGFLAYQEMTQRQAAVHHAVWSPVSHLFVAPNFAPPFAAQASGPPGY
jgi:hypothetical protein